LNLLNKICALLINHRLTLNACANEAFKGLAGISTSEKKNLLLANKVVARK
jgi:hypothetical protein